MKENSLQQQQVEQAVTIINEKNTEKDEEKCQTNEGFIDDEPSSDNRWIKRAFETITKTLLRTL